MAREDIERISHTFDNGVTVVNTTPHPLNFQDSVSGETVVIPTSVPEGERMGDFVVNAGSNEVDLGGGLVTTEFVPSDEGIDRIQEIKDWAADEGKDVRIVGSMIAAQAYPMDVVGMVAAPGFERVPPQDKLMSVEKFTAFQGETNNDVTDDKVKELENKIESAEIKTEIIKDLGDTKASLIYDLDPNWPTNAEEEAYQERCQEDKNAIEKIEDALMEKDFTKEELENIKEDLEKADQEDGLTYGDVLEKIESDGYVDMENDRTEQTPLEVEDKPLDENTVGDSSEKMEEREYWSEEDWQDKIDELKEEIKVELENKYEDSEDKESIIENISSAIDTIAEKAEDLDNEGKEWIVDNFEKILESDDIEKVEDTIKDIQYEIKIEDNLKEEVAVSDDDKENAKIEMEEAKEHSSPLVAALKEEGFEVVSAWETVEIVTEDGDHVLVEEQDDYTYDVIMLAEDGDPRIDDEGNEMVENVSYIDEIIDTINDFKDRVSGDDSDPVAGD